MVNRKLAQKAVRIVRFVQFGHFERKYKFRGTIGKTDRKLFSVVQSDFNPKSGPIRQITRIFRKNGKFNWRKFDINFYYVAKSSKNVHF